MSNVYSSTSQQPGATSALKTAWPFHFDELSEEAHQLHDGNVSDLALAACLSEHLRPEFPEVPWPDHWMDSELPPPPPELFDILWLVWHRRTFIGRCAVCQTWPEPDKIDTEIDQLGAEVEKKAGELLKQAASQAIVKRQIGVETALAEFAKDRKQRGRREQSTIKHNYIPFLRRFFAGDETVPTDPEIIGKRLEPYSQNTHNTYWLYLHAFYHFLEVKHGLPNPMTPDTVPRPGTEDTLPRHLNPEEKRQLEDVKSKLTPRDRALIDLLQGTAIRPGEVVGDNGHHPLRFCDIYDNHIEVSGKVGERVVPISPELRDDLLSLRDGHPADSPIFLADRGGRLTQSGLGKIVKRAARQAGIKGRVTPYSFRHSFGAEFLAGGGDLATLQRILGHKHIETTMIYTHLADRQMIDTYRRTRGANNILLFAPQSGQPLEGDLARLLPQLLDEMVRLGEKARYLSQVLGGNGHRPEKAAELIDLIRGGHG